MCRSAPPPAVRIRTTGVTPGELEKALEATLAGLVKGREAQGRDELRELNPAARELVQFIEDSYRQMVGSLGAEILKVLGEG